MKTLEEAGFLKTIGKFIKHYISKKLNEPKVLPDTRMNKGNGYKLTKGENTKNIEQWSKAYGEPHEHASEKYHADPEKYDKMKQSKSQKELYSPYKPPKYGKPKPKKEKKDIDYSPLTPEQKKANNPDRFDFTS